VEGRGEAVRLAGVEVMGGRRRDSPTAKDRERAATRLADDGPMECATTERACRGHEGGRRTIPSNTEGLGSVLGMSMTGGGSLVAVGWYYLYS
jgi:hypothetical protein